MFKSERVEWRKLYLYAYAFENAAWFALPQSSLLIFLIHSAFNRAEQKGNA